MIPPTPGRRVDYLLVGPSARIIACFPKGFSIDGWRASRPAPCWAWRRARWCCEISGRSRAFREDNQHIVALLAVIQYLPDSPYTSVVDLGDTADTSRSSAGY